ncbi:MAG: hypothetical protein JXR83_02035 [Deltaproteobacteria bacterium]|nr:hypothetical protein [Deltaproteobacteria bacterium]
MQRTKVVMAIALIAATGGGCAAFSYRVDRGTLGEVVANAAAPIYVEPMLENAELELKSASSGDTTVYYKDKPYFAQPGIRKRVHGQVLEQLASKFKLVAPTAGEDFYLVRTTVAEHKETDSNAMWQYISCIGPVAFFVLCPISPLAWIYNALVPVRSEQQIRLIVQLFRIPSAEAKARTVAVPDSIYPLVNTDGLQPVAQREFLAQGQGEAGIWNYWFVAAEERDKLMTGALAEYTSAAIGQVVASVGTDSGAPAPADQAAPSSQIRSF